MSEDLRVENDILRRDYRILSEEEKMQIAEVKDLGAGFIAACNRIGRSRELSLAITKAEEATMWAVKYITGPKP